MTGRTAILAALATVAVIAALAATMEDSSAQSPAFSLQKRGEQVCTAGWLVDLEWRAAEDARDAFVDGQALSGSGGVVQVECGRLPADWKLWAARYGTLPMRVVSGGATTAEGHQVTARVRLRIVPPLPPLPAPTVTAAIGDVQDGTLRVLIGDGAAVGRDVEEARVAVRWREVGEEQWRVDVYGSGGWGVDLGIPVWLVPGEYEVQAALLRNTDELHRPDPLAWSEPATRMTVEPPLDIIAEATHDTITVLLPEGLNLDNARYQLYGPDALHVVDGTGRDRLTWTGLRPDETYTLFAQRRPAGERGSIVALEVNTEPAPPGWAGAPDSWGIVSAEAFPDRIELAWHAPEGAEDSPYSVSFSPWGDGEPFSRTFFLPMRESLYVSPYRIPSAWSGTGSWRRIDVLVDAEYRATIDDLRPGSTYVIHVVRYTVGAVLGSRLVVEMPEPVTAEPVLAAPPPPSVEYNARPWDACTGGRNARFVVSADESDDWDAVEFEWEVEGWRARDLYEGLWPLWFEQSRPGEHVFRVRVRRGDDWSAWSEPALGVPRPTRPSIISTSARTDAGIRLAWVDYYSEPAPDPDWHLVRWSLDDGEPQEAVVRDAKEFVVPLAPEWEGRLQVTVTGVHRDYGEGMPSRPIERDLSHRPLEISAYLGKCRPVPGWEGRASVRIEGGIAPYTVRAAGGETVTDDYYGASLKFDCGEFADDGEIHWQVIDAAGTERSGIEPLEVLEFEPGGARPTAPIWAFAEADRTDVRAVWHCLSDLPEEGASYQIVDPYLLRWRAAEEEVWRYQPGRDYGLERLCWAELSDLQPGTAYEIEVAGYRNQPGLAHPDELSWSAPLTVRTVGQQPAPQVVRDGERLIVSWTPQSDAIRYLVRLRSDGRSWWRLVHAFGGDQETVEFAVPSSAEYEAEIVPAPQIWGEYWPATRPNRYPGQSGPC